jgi:hypothetical protein
LELLSGWETVCILIDDFNVPGDEGYAYDDYGQGFALDVRLLSGLPLEDVFLFFPRISSVEETGRRRGWVVLARGRDLVDKLLKLEELTVREAQADGQP